MSDKKDVDQPTGVETTGHEWDGVKELNNPLPRWWLYIFYASIVASVIYMIFMPAIPLPGGYTKGTLNHSDRENVAADIEALRSARAEAGAGLESMTLQQIEADPKTLEFALAAGDAAFGDNCATCHGVGAQGFPGYPNLRDDDWIWGGTLDDIETTIRYGIRSEHDMTRMNAMPAFGKDGILSPEQVNDMVEYVLTLSNSGGDAAAAARAQQTYAEQCAVCHGETGEGVQPLGAPDLSDRIWLYGGDRDSIRETIMFSRAGVMPAWDERLDNITIRSLAVYVHTLGGGEE